MTTTIALAARIEQLETELAALRQQLQAARDGHLLLAIAAAVGDYAFTAAELVAHARVDVALRDALGPCVRPRQVGKRLSRLSSLHGSPFGLRCIGDSSAGCIWVITESP